MKRIALLSIAVSLAAAPVLSQSPRGEATLTLAGKSLAIEYGRPSLRGRDMLSRIQVGQPWRMGADAATTLRTEADLAFGKVRVPKGNYVLEATKVTEEAWQLEVMDGERKQLAQIPLTAVKLDEKVETFTIELTERKGGGEFVMMWDTIALKASFTAK